MTEFTVGSWVVKPERNTVVRGNTERRLEPRVMDLLAFLARNSGRVLSHDQIIGNVWPHTYVSDSALQSAVSVLRKALDDDPRSPEFLETIPKRGYRLIAHSSAAIPVVAVLPFSNLTGDDDRIYIADGITDALIAALGRHTGVRVISRQSVMTFRDSHESLPEIAGQLDAGAIVEGSVISAADRISVTVQLLDTASDTHVWADSLTFERGHLFRAAEAAAGQIAQHVSPDNSDAGAGARSETIDAEATRHYLLGRFHWYKLNPAHFPRALDHFEKAIEISPGFCAALAGVADVWGAFGYWGALPAREVRDRIREAVFTALDIDPDDADANMLAGAYEFLVARNWREAGARFERALDANPNLAHARLLYALFLATTRLDAARPQIERACQLDPVNPAVLYGSALCHCGNRHYEAAQSDLAQVLELEPYFPPALELRADLAWMLGEADAMDYEHSVWRGDESVLDALDRPRPGTDAGKLLKAGRLLERRASEQYVSPRVIARLFSLAERPDEAIRVLNEAIDQDDFMQPDLLQLLPAFEPTRHDNAFSRIQARIGLPDIPD